MAASLKSLIQGNTFVVAPGIADALGARMVSRCGFPAVYVSGNQVSAQLGYPDVGLVTMSEMVSQLGHICSAVDLPVISDADTGYGGPVNVLRTVREYERIGVSALHIEDQVFPKKCARYGGKEMLPVAEMCGKIKAAADARRSAEFLILGRTDALGITNLDDAIERGNAYREAGADAVMFMSPRSISDLEKFRKQVAGPLVVTLGSWDLNTDVDGLRKLGYQMVLIPNLTQRATIKAMMTCLEGLKSHGDIEGLNATVAPLSMRDELVGTNSAAEWDQKYATA